MKTLKTGPGRAPRRPTFRALLWALLGVLTLGMPATPVAQAQSPRLVTARYWFDSGTKTTMTASDGAFDAALESALSVAAGTLSIGSHSLRLEMQGADGQWGPAVTSTVVVQSATARAVKIQSGEVQLDNNTAAAVIATDGAFNSAVEEVVKGGLVEGALGNHTVRIRLKDAQGNFGPWFTSAYVVQSSIARAVKIQSGEVQLDNNTPAAVVAVDGAFNAAVEEVVKGGLLEGAVGNHTVRIRLKDGLGNFGPWFNSVYVVQSATARAVKVQSARFWFDAGPKTTMVALDGSFNSALESAVNASASSLAVGVHSVSVEMQDAAGTWGPVFTSSLVIQSASARTVSIQTGEVWWDNQATRLALIVVNDNLSAALGTASQALSTSGLAVGPHMLRFRMMGQDGQWGPTISMAVQVNPCKPVPTAPTASASPVSVSTNQVVTLAVSNPVAGQTYQWTGPGLAASSGTSVTAVPTTQGTATYQVVAMSSGGCISSAATVNVTVTAPSAAPTIISFTPDNGPVGANVTLTGTDFSGTTAVTFNGVAANGFTVIDNFRISAVVPATATTGKLAVTTPAGSAQSATSFKVLPTITSFTPTSGTPHTPATVVTITGSGFLGATAVKFGTGTATSFTVVNSTTITATVPTLAITGKISVTTPGGTGSSTRTFNVAPTITSFTPGQGAPGSVVLVFGRNFTSGTTSSIKFNGLNATTVYNSSTQLTATVPNGATTGPLTVTTTYGSHTSSASYNVVVGTPPTITSFSPTNEVIKGTVVTINGTGFTGATAVRFNNVNAPAFTVLSNTQLQAAVPTDATTGKIYVTTPSGMAQSASNLTIVPPPTIATFSPGTGAVGSVVLLTGANYSGPTFAGVTSVTLNGASVPFTINSESQIAVTIQAGATSGKFTVTNIAGTAISTADFIITTAVPAPTITTVTPGTGAVGMTVIINGTNFIGVTEVKFNTAAATYVRDSPTQITATVPSTATTGKIYVTTKGGMAQSPTDFIVVKPPTITSFTPTSGPVGTLVTINGVNFAGITAVSFGGTIASSYTVVSTTKITATVPPGAVTGKVQVTNAAGTATSVASFTVTSPRPVAPVAAAAAEPIRLTVVPNPAHETVEVFVEGSSEAFRTVELYAITGHRLRTVPLTQNGVVRLPLDGVPPGVYFVRYGLQTERLVVE